MELATKVYFLVSGSICTSPGRAADGPSCSPPPAEELPYLKMFVLGRYLELSEPPMHGYVACACFLAL